MTTDRWQQVIRLLDQAYYEDGLVALRKRVVEDMRQKLKECGVLDQRREASTPRSGPRRRITCCQRSVVIRLSTKGTGPLSAQNFYNRVFKPALNDAGSRTSDSTTSGIIPTAGLSRLGVPACYG